MLLRLYLRSKIPPFLLSPSHVPSVYSQSHASFFVTSLKQVFAAQHRLVNQQLSALAKRIHGFTVETVKPSK
jgi:stress-induced morphogen